jgi:DNA modification methylase
MNKVYFGDCRDSMRQMAKENIKVQTCITSPPYYGLRDYGHEGQIGNEQTPKEFIDNLVEVFACVWDILADDGTLWVNLGDSYYNYRPGKGQALNKQTVSSNNQDLPQECARRGNKLDGYKEKDLMGMPWRLAFALQDFGWTLRQDIIWHKPNPMPESVKDRCTKSHEYIFLLSKNSQYYFDNEAIKEKSLNSGKIISLGEKSMSKGQAKGKNISPSGNGNLDFYNVLENRNKRSVWTISTKPYSGAHFAVYPEELIEPCVMAGSKVGDIVLDPFFGSGTTGAVAQKLGRQYIGCELNQDYELLQKERLKQGALELI